MVQPGAVQPLVTAQVRAEFQHAHPDRSRRADYRVPIGEGMQLFTAVQRKGIDSKMLIFPDEGHWVLKPQNSQLWFHTVLDWLDKYLQPTSATSSMN